MTLARDRSRTVLVATLAASGLAELVFLRVAYRVGLFVPRDPVASAAYQAVTTVGSFAFDLTTALALLLAFAGALEAGRTRMTRALLASVATLAIAVGLWPDPPDALRAALAGAAALAALAIASPAVADRSAPPADRTGLAVVALLIAVVQTRWAMEILLAGTVGGDALPASAGAIELAAVGAAVLFAAAAVRAGRAGPVPIVAAVAIAAAFGAAAFAWPYVVAIVLLWAGGVTLALPLPAYAIALAALVLAALAEARTRPDRAAALALLVVAGIVPQTTTHVMVAVLAVAVLATSRNAVAAERSRTAIAA